MVARTPAILCKTRCQHTTAQIAPVLRRNKVGAGLPRQTPSLSSTRTSTGRGSLRPMFRLRRTLAVLRRSDYALS
ncbi:hypothetical protein PTE31013_00209 [Pandoraea terrigena]|uniref:Uncharacterized protein n=1 Tax=Pandoraea terrigena TaxID=2508292 RepID=A0A5E4RK37_9BURK|nr:hypothetical protein PTE31013_00209 [Pandoraea terrigena]